MRSTRAPGAKADDHEDDLVVKLAGVTQTGDGEGHRQGPSNGLPEQAAQLNDFQPAD